MTVDLVGPRLVFGTLLLTVTWLRNVRTPLRNGVDESLVTQGPYGAPGGRTRDLVCLD